MAYIFDLAERLHMTVAQLLANTNSIELGYWMARDQVKAEQQRLDNLAARAEAGHRRKR